MQKSVECGSESLIFDAHYHAEATLNVYVVVFFLVTSSVVPSALWICIAKLHCAFFLRHYQNLIS